MESALNVEFEYSDIFLKESKSLAKHYSSFKVDLEDKVILAYIYDKNKISSVSKRSIQAILRQEGLIK